MPFASLYLAEEALALPAEQREELAKLLMASLLDDGRSDEEVGKMLRSRLDDLKTGRDPGLSFEEIFPRQI